MITNNPAPADVLQYYSYDVTTNAVAVSFEVLKATNDIDMVVRRDLPLPDSLNFDYASANPGTNNEAVFIFTNSLPVPLTPGRWYIGVYRYTDTNAAPYTILATEFTAINPLIVLTNRLPLRRNRSRQQHALFRRQCAR